MSSFYELESREDKFIGRPAEAGLFLDERRRAALAKADSAKFSWFHAKVCCAAGVGFFTDAYDLFAINIASTMLGYVYGSEQKLNRNQDLCVKVAGPVGSLFGQLLFGWLADTLGRKRMYGLELSMMIFATFAQAVSGSSTAISIIAALTMWRFIMGVAIGGDYPLSAIITSEFAPAKIRGRMMTVVFAAQGWGNFTAALTGFIITAAFKTTILRESAMTNLASIDYMWRILIGLGCVPGVIALYFRLTIPETPRFTMDIERNINQASADIETILDTNNPPPEEQNIIRIETPRGTWSDFIAHFSQRSNFQVLFGAAYSWFALDIAFYGLGLNSGIILQAIGFGTPVTQGVPGVYQNLKNICVGNLILSVAGLIPGYWASFFFIDKWGRKPIQLLGFAMLTIILTIMGFCYEYLTATTSATKVFVVLYCLANFFQNFGPNTTTFIIPGEVFPTRYRSTAHGISAASGKLGAIIAQVGFAQLKDIGGPNSFVKHILKIFAFFMLTGILSTLILPETKGRSLEDLSNEKQEGFVKENFSAWNCQFNRELRNHEFTR